MLLLISNYKIVLKIGKKNIRKMHPNLYLFFILPILVKKKKRKKKILAVDTMYGKIRARQIKRTKLPNFKAATFLSHYLLEKHQRRVALKLCVR